jgi:peptide/nickel transport system substrate-binding protein
MDECGYWNLRRRRVSRRLVLGSAAAATAVAVACGNRGAATHQSQAGSSAPSAANQTPVIGGQFNVSQIATPPTLDTQRNTSGNIGNAAGAVQSCLLRFKTGADVSVFENHDVESDLALSVESPDAITWTVKLRPDASFHNVAPVNGHAVESDDIKATFLRALGKDNPGRAALDMMDPDQIQTSDKQTVVFKLKYPYASFAAKMASTAYGSIFPREILAGSYDSAKTLIGSGPFILDSFTPDVAYILKKNPSWFEKGRPYVDSVRWGIIPDQSQVQAQFTGGHLDLIGNLEGVPVAPNDVATYSKDNPKAVIIKASPSSPQDLYFQLGDPASAFQDIRLRRAFSMAIDRDALKRAVWNNDAAPMYQVHLDLGKWALHENELPAETAQWYKFDPANAKKLLDAAGATDRVFKLLYIVPFQGPEYVKVSLAVANMLQQAGIKITAVQQDYTKDYFGGGKGIRYGNYDKDSVVCTGISALDDVDDYLYNYFSSNATQGLSKLKDPDVDSMISKARTLVDITARVKAYKDIQIYLSDKMYTVAGLPEPYVYNMVAPRVQNFSYSNSHGYGTETFSKLWLQG